MRTLQSAVLALITIAVAACAALADEQARPGNARARREFVGYNCDARHVVAANQDNRPLFNGYAPRFFEVANKPGTTREAADLTNVVAYIMSLGRRQ